MILFQALELNDKNTSKVGYVMFIQLVDIKTTKTYFYKIIETHMTNSDLFNTHNLCILHAHKLV